MRLEERLKKMDLQQIHSYIRQESKRFAIWSTTTAFDLAFLLPSLANIETGLKDGYSMNNTTDNLQAAGIAGGAILLPYSIKKGYNAYQAIIKGLGRYNK